MPTTDRELMTWSRHEPNGLLVINRYQDLYEAIPELVATGGLADAADAILLWADSHVVTVFSAPCDLVRQTPLDDDLERLVPIVAATMHEMRSRHYTGWFDDQGRPWWKWRGYTRSQFLRRDFQHGTEDPRMSDRIYDVLERGMHDLETPHYSRGLDAFLDGKVPRQGIGGRCVFVVPPDPDLEQWKEYLGQDWPPAPEDDPYLPAEF